VCIGTAMLVASVAPAGASVGSDQTQISRLEHKIAAEGERVKSLVTRYNDAQLRLGALDAQILRDQRTLKTDEAVESAATRVLRRIAIRAYVTVGESSSPTLALFSDTADTTNMFEQTSYLGALNGKWNRALTVVQLDHATTKDLQGTLRSERDRAQATVHQLADARDAAQSAIASENATLSHVRGDLRAQLAAAAEQRRAEQAAEERALAAAVAPREPSPPLIATPGLSVVARESPSPRTPSIPIPVPTQQPTGPPAAGYANPLRGVSALTSERIDQGVDYAGFGPIYAIGNGVVLSTSGPGWPGGTFIAYRLTDGPGAGLVVYAAEDIAPSVQPGATVSSNTVLGQVYAGPDGIETGWADGAALPDTMARAYGQFGGSNSTAFGYNFSRLLQSLGAPPGILENNPPTGSLPAGWPSW